MAKHNERKLSLIWDKRQKDFVVKYPRRCDGALIVNTLLSDVLRWCLPDQADNKGYPYNWKKENLKEEKVRWLILGNGRLYNWVHEEIKRRGLESSVLLLGQFPTERMPSFYKHAQALLVSLKSDNFLSLTIPAKVQSYLVSGIPIVGMLDGDGAKVIKEAKAGIVCPAGDGLCLSNAIRNMLSMPYKTSEDSMDLSTSNYDADKCYEKW